MEFSREYLGHEGWILKILEIPGRMCRRSSKTKHPMVQTHMFHNKTATLGYFRGTVCTKFKHINPRFQVVEPKARSKNPANIVHEGTKLSKPAAMPAPLMGRGRMISG